MLRKKLDSTFDASLSQLVWLGLLVVGPTLALTAWAAVQSWAGPLVGLFAIGTAGCTMWVVNQGRQVFRTKPTKPTGKVLGDQIRNALFDKGYTITPWMWPEGEFLFKVADEFGRIVGVSKGKLDTITIDVGFAPTQDERRVIDSMTVKQRAEFAHNLRIELARFGVWFTGMAEPFEAMHASRDLDITTEFDFTDFMKEFETVRRAHVLIQSLFGIQMLNTEVRGAQPIAFPTIPSVPGTGGP